jgi:Holliday junction resolvase-like predicted endonuclease
LDIEINLIISILKLTENGSVSKEIVKNDARISSQIVEKLLRKLQNQGFIYLRKNFVEADAVQRLKLAVYAIELGADFERVCSFLWWKEFEGMAALVLERNGYAVKKNLWFRHYGKKWEVDVVGYKKPIILCLDCKHWRYGMHPSTLKKIAEEQRKRTKALAKFLPSLVGKFEFASWDKAKIVPAVLSLVPGRFKFYKEVPIVPVLQFQDFINQLPAYA